MVACVLINLSQPWLLLGSVNLACTTTQSVTAQSRAYEVNHGIWSGRSLRCFLFTVLLLLCLRDATVCPSVAVLVPVPGFLCAALEHCMLERPSRTEVAEASPVR